MSTHHSLEYFPEAERKETEMPGDLPSRRDVLKRLLVWGSVLSTGGEFSEHIAEAQEKEKGYPIEVQEKGEGKHVKLGLRILDAKNPDPKKRVDISQPLPPGTYKLFAAAGEPGHLQEVLYEVVDAATGKVVERFPQTHVPLNNVRIDAGQKLRIVKLPAIQSVNKPYETQRKKEKTAEDAGKEGHPIQMKRLQDIEGQHHFGLYMTATNVDTKKTEESVNGRPSLKLPPGTYDLYAQNSRTGFPQPVSWVVRKTDGTEVERTPTHIQLIRGTQGLQRLAARLVIERDEQVTVEVRPAVRPYDAVFFTLGKEKTTDAGIIFPRPYPSQDFAPGTFRGREQFNAAPMAIAFWGTKLAGEQKEEAATITKDGVPGLRPGTLYKDPVLVLGCRKVARDLAQGFVDAREKHGEDYRCEHHISLLLHLPEDGKIPPELLRMSVDTLAELCEKQLLRMMHHNVHRINEGGGYADKSFLDDFEEAKAKIKQWPEVSISATELFRVHLRTVDETTKGKGLKEEVQIGKEKKTVYDHQRIAILGLQSAGVRERKNYETYPADMLEKAKMELAKITKVTPEQSIAKRTEDLQKLDAELEKRLKDLEPK